jgi:hypothetical protein
VVCGKPFKPTFKTSECCSQNCRKQNLKWRTRLSKTLKEKYVNDPTYKQMLKDSHAKFKGKTYEQIFGDKRAKAIKKKLSKASIESNRLIKEKQKAGYARHKTAILETMKKYQENGYACAPVSNEFPRPDIVAFKDGKIFAIEIENNVEGVNPSKYCESTIYADVMWHVYHS